MARCPEVPQDPDIDANSAGLADIDPIAAVVHDTIGVYSGPDSGDSQYIEDHRLAHFSIGEDEGEWEQLIDTAKFAAHANGANRKAFGVEFSALQSGQPLTAWQKRAWAVIRKWAVTAHGIPDTYVDPESVPDASVWVNGGGFTGWISHRNVRTDDGSAQHTDYVPAADFAPAAQPATKPLIPEDLMQFVHNPNPGRHDEVWCLAGNTRRQIQPSELQRVQTAFYPGGPYKVLETLPVEEFNSYPVAH